MRKGITPVISIIVLLLITVSIAGMGWTYLSGYYQGMISKTIKIVEGSQRDNEVMIMNIGTEEISSGELKVLVNGEEATILNPQSIEPKKSAVIKFYTTVYGDSLNVRVMAPGNAVSYTESIEPVKILVIEERDSGGFMNKLRSLGFEVINNTSITTIQEVQARNPGIVACFRPAWSCTKYALFNQLYDAGYSVFTEGNDHTDVIYPIASHVNVPSGNASGPVQSVGTHPIAQGWSTTPNSGTDSRWGITGIHPGAAEIARDMTHGLVEIVYLEQSGKGKWYHHQPLVYSYPPDQLLINAVYSLMGYSI